MPLAETLLIAVGSSVSKSVLKLWIKDNDLMQDAAITVADIIKGHVGEVFAQSKSEEQFKKIGARVAENLLTFFENEGRSIDEGGQEAVAFALANSLNKVSIGPELLVGQNLKPVALTRLIIESSKNEILGFSEPEVELFNKVVHETSGYIIEITAQLPSFNEHAFAEVLKREDMILAAVNEILEEVRRIREGSQNTNQEEVMVRFENDYRITIARNLNKMELYGAGTGVTESKRYPLSVAYIGLTAQVEKLDQANEGTLLEESEETLETLRITQVVEGSPRLLLLGLAGSGKTTLLKWLAHQAASRKFAGTLSEFNNKVPFFVRLREFASQDLPGPEDFPKLVAQALAGKMPEGWVHGLLEEGRALVLIDGVDEIADRDRVRDWIEDLVGSFGKNYFVVTSRPYEDVQPEWLDAVDFRSAELQPMELSDIFAFIDHWHRAVLTITDRDEEKAELDGLAQNLVEVIKTTSAIRNLATNPLLCALLCALHRDLRQELPKDRIDLYGTCFQMLLERRDVERKVDMVQYPNLRYRQKLTILQDFAYHLITNKWPEVDTERAEQRVKNRLRNMEGLPENATPPNVLRLLLDRSGIIREPVAGRVDFTHRTFQEYLAAEQAIVEGDLGILVGNAHDDQWREIIILAVGLARPKERSEIISGLIKRGDAEESSREKMHLLAVACLETAIDIEPSVKRKLDQRLTKLLPPKNLTAAKSLALAGDLAIPYLIKYTSSRASEAAACVRTLVEIGSEEALNALEKFSRDGRKTVINELVRGWGYYDANEYADKIITKAHIDVEELLLNYHEDEVRKKLIPNLHEATFVRLTEKDVDLLSMFANLVQLLIDTEAPPFYYFTNRAHFDLWDLPSYFLRRLHPQDFDMPEAPLLDLFALNHLRNLEALSIFGFNIINSNGDIDLPKLKSLSVEGRIEKRFRDSFENLVKKATLKNLFLRTSGLEDLSFLKVQSHLKSLYITVKPKTNLEPIFHLNLENLALENADHFSFNSFDNLESLNRICLINSVGINLDGLSDFSELKVMYLIDCEGVVGFEGIENLDVRIYNYRQGHLLEYFLYNIDNLSSVDSYMEDARSFFGGLEPFEEYLLQFYYPQRS